MSTSSKFGGAFKKREKREGVGLHQSNSIITVFASGKYIGQNATTNKGAVLFARCSSENNVIKQPHGRSKEVAKYNKLSTNHYSRPESSESLKNCVFPVKSADKGIEKNVTTKEEETRFSSSRANEYGKKTTAQGDKKSQKTTHVM